MGICTTKDEHPIDVSCPPQEEEIFSIDLDATKKDLIVIIEWTTCAISVFLLLYIILEIVRIKIASYIRKKEGKMAKTCQQKFERRLPPMYFNVRVPNVHMV